MTHGWKWLQLFGGWIIDISTRLRSCALCDAYSSLFGSTLSGSLDSRSTSTDHKLQKYIVMSENDFNCIIAWKLEAANRTFCKVIIINVSSCVYFTSNFPVKYLYFFKPYMKIPKTAFHRLRTREFKNLSDNVWLTPSSLPILTLGNWSRNEVKIKNKQFSLQNKIDLSPRYFISLLLPSKNLLWSFRIYYRHFPSYKRKHGYLLYRI